MPTIHQLIKTPRFIHKLKSKAPALVKSPQKKGVCIRVYIRNPKKPNSAKRKVTNVLLTSG
jgi:small subunit ribosomal protein S12